jgi:hypothetical protein
MTWSDPGLLVNVLVVVLLVAVIVHAVLLNRRLKTWRSEAGEMERLIITFNSAVNRAEAAMAGLKQVTREDGHALDVAQKRATALRDDLAYLVDRGTSLADRLEQAVRGGLAQLPAEPAPATPTLEPPPKPKTESPAKPGAHKVSDAEKRLMAALETMK